MAQDLRTESASRAMDIVDMGPSAEGLSSHAMLNAPDAVRDDPVARRFEIGELLFAQFSCPGDKVGIWTQTDFLMHVVSGTAIWKIVGGTGYAHAGEAIFFRKGAYVLPPHVMDGELCVQFYFIPDGFVRETLLQLTAELPVSAERTGTAAMVMRLTPDVALSAFFRAMQVYFASKEDPPEALLRLKLTELLTSILLSRNNLELSAYLQSLAAAPAPCIAAIMEENYQHNLPLQAFAAMCHRSLSSFKRDFRKHYGTSPGKWMLERRLERAVWLLQTTRVSITEVTFECGFEDLSHFSKAFKERFGQPPSEFRRARA